MLDWRGSHVVFMIHHDFHHELFVNCRYIFHTLYSGNERLTV